jgi:hypothetical protein
MPNDAAPFGPDKTMLPPLYVYNPQTGKIEKVGEKPKNNFWANLFNGPGRRAKDPNIPKEVWVDPNPKPVEIPIEIMLVGGGYFGGVDPVERNYIQIKPTGRCIKEYKTVSRDVMKTKKDIPRQQLEDLVRFIADKKFFAMSNIYDCDAPECIKRKTQKPTPIPLRLYVRYGDKQKSITVNIWGRDGNTARYINYPPELDIIIENILLISETQ